MNLAYEISRLKSDFLNFTFPLHCTFCGDRDSSSLVMGLCKSCKPPRVSLDENLCMVCKSPIFEGICRFCQSRNIFFERLEFLVKKDEIHREIMNRIKFENEIYLANYFRYHLGRLWKKFQFPEFSFLTSIPSNLSSRRLRPLPPIFSVMNFLEKKIGLKETSLLEKVSSEKQSEKAFEDRFFHARYSFAIQKNYKELLSGNVLLIDDIFTTGASMNEASRILLENGARKVYLLVLLKGETGI